jgi:NADPH:quinone reductase-like Zn-dependent oxidoreductase
MIETMQAMIVEAHGGPEVIKPVRLPRPEPAFDQVVVAVKACALNHLDLWVRKGIPGIKLPIILGCDIAGEIAALGEGVTHLKVGDKILVCPGISCGHCQYCLSGEENLCRHYQILGENCDGGYAEFVAVPARNCFAIPKVLNFHQAAAIPLVFMTAWHMLVSRVQMKMNETVLVVGGGSGVGSAAIQIAKLYRCHVITTVGDEEKAKQAKALGADDVIIHTKQKIKDEVKRITDKRGVDIVFEHVGPAVFPDCLQSLAKGGRLVTCGATTGPTAEVDLPRLFMKHQAIYGSIMGTMSEIAYFLPFFDQGLLKPVVDTVLPLSQAKQAHELLESRKQFGKVVLDPTI